MNTSPYNPSGVHQEHNVVVTQAQHNNAHTATNVASLGYLHQQAPLQLHPSQQLPMDHQHSHQLAATITNAPTDNTHSTTSTGAVFDPRRVQLSTPLEKAFYSAATATVSGPATSAHFYTTPSATGTNSITDHHHHQHGNTILITNNFASQQYTPATQAHAPQNATAVQLQQQSASALAGIPSATATNGNFNGNGNNIRIITTLPNPLQQNVMSQQQIYNIVKDDEHHQPSEPLQLHQPPYFQPQQTSHFAPQLHSSLLPQHFAQQHFTATQLQTNGTATHIQLPTATPQFFMPLTDTNSNPPAAAVTNTTASKLLPTLGTLPGGNISATSSSVVNADVTTPPTTITPATANSTVVLDRINICINNHYSDSIATSSTTMDSTMANSHALTNVTHTQQPSPIIPAIHHKVVVDTSGSGNSGSCISGALHIDPYASNDSTLVIDEPDSTTTTPHTPPTTPENSCPPLSSTITSQPIQSSPSKEAQATTTTTETSKTAFSVTTDNVELIEDDNDAVIEVKDIIETRKTSFLKENSTTFEDVPAQQTAAGNKDVSDGSMVQCSILNNAKIELSSVSAEVELPSQVLLTNTPPPTSTSATLLSPSTPRTPPKGTQVNVSYAINEDTFVRNEDGRLYLGTVIEISENTQQHLVRFNDKSEIWCGVDRMRKLGNKENVNESGQMCVACKRMQRHDVVEICERCGRGYHRGCTIETSADSGVWWCKRCCKPMKNFATLLRRQLSSPSHAETLKWDEKHQKLNSKLHKENGCSYKNTSESSKPLTDQRESIADIYEFRIEDEEKFTSEDEIPIKRMMEKVQKVKDEKANVKSKVRKYAATASLKKISADDENANDANCGLMAETPKRNQQKLQHDKKQPTKSNKDFPSEMEHNSCCVGNEQSTQLYHQNDSETKVAANVVTINTATEKSSHKRKAFTLSNTYKEIAAEAAAKPYDSSRICDSSSDDNSSSSRGTSLDVIIPPPKNFLGLNNPFRIVTPKKGTSTASTKTFDSGHSLLPFSRSGTMIKSSIFNTTALDFSSKLAALKNAGMFPNLSTSNLAKAAGQPRTVRTIRRRLSAKDITIGPNQEVRRRRTRRPSANVEVISTTTINPIPTNFFPLYTKDLHSNATNMTAPTHTASLTTAFKPQQQQQTRQQQNLPAANNATTSSSASSSPPASVSSSVDSGQLEVLNKPTHGRRLRQRPQKISPGNSRRNSISGASTSSTNSSSNITLATLQQQVANKGKSGVVNSPTASSSAEPTMQDLKQTVKEYFGAVNRIESGEQFTILAKRTLPNGQVQYLLEWGDATNATTSTTGAPTETS